LATTNLNGAIGLRANRDWAAPRILKSGLGCAEPYDCYFMIHPRNFYKVDGR
jgi:hypothetical protein